MQGQTFRQKGVVMERFFHIRAWHTLQLMTRDELKAITLKRCHVFLFINEKYIQSPVDDTVLCGRYYGKIDSYNIMNVVKWCYILPSLSACNGYSISHCCGREVLFLIGREILRTEYLRKQKFLDLPTKAQNSRNC